MSMYATDGSGFAVFAFDRDETVDVNPHPERESVPLSWVRSLAHDSPHEVWAIGNQQLKSEADIYGVREAVLELENEWHREFATTEDDYEVDGWPRRGRRVTMLSDLFPEATAYVVVDDKDLSYVDGWTHYFPWEFVDAVRENDIDGVELDGVIETG